MSDDQQGADVINLWSRSKARPDMATMACEQFRSMRMSADSSREEFAEALGQLLGWTVTESVVESWETHTPPPGDVLVAAGFIAKSGPVDVADARAADMVSQLTGNRFADVTAVYASRSEFTASLPPHSLFADAKRIRAAGLSLNVIVQQYSVGDLSRLITQGASVQCLFLAPGGDAIASREREEGYRNSELAALTSINIQSLVSRVRDHLDEQHRSRLEIATYDETIRFNILLIDKTDEDRLCVFQPYLPASRGVDSPTFVANRRWPNAGLYPAFEAVFDALWERSERV
jgi:Domain of unknown function (DUF5919)